MALFCIKIAGLPIGIDNRFSYVRQLCRGYETDEAPLFTVRASDEELRRQSSGRALFQPPEAGPAAYYESLCLYRNLCLRLPEYDGFLIHGAAVARDGQAYLFCAPSGTGKSTHIQLWGQQFGREVQVINGDKPILRFLGGTLCACGSPWNGKERWGQNLICPVAGICFLEQAPDNQIQRLSTSEISRRLFHQLLLPSDPVLFDRFWGLLDRMVATVPFYLLRCNQKPDAALLAYHTMRRQPDAENKTGISSAAPGR